MKKTPMAKKTDKTAPAKCGLKKTLFYPPMIIDNEPIRRKHVQSFKKISFDLDRARAEWAVFEKEDKPAFRKWLNSTFGRELTILRDMQDKVHKMEHLLNEIENCKYIHRITYFQAYEQVMDMRENPEKYKDKYYGEDSYYDDSEDCKADSESGYSSESDKYETNEEDLRAIFIEFMRETKPDLLKTISKDKNLFEKAFSIFKEEYYGDVRIESGRRQDDDENNTEAGTRIRALYRDLVRRLHPDSRKETNGQYDEIWHEVQAAYRDNNLERMEVLSALCNAHTGDFYETASFSQLIQVQQEYKMQLKAMLEQIKRGKDDPAWGFSKIGNAMKVKQYIRNDLVEGIEVLKYKIDEMELILKRWSKPPQRKNYVPAAKTPVKKNPKPVFEDSEVQLEIPF